MKLDQVNHNSWIGKQPRRKDKPEYPNFRSKWYYHVVLKVPTMTQYSNFDAPTPARSRTAQKAQ